MAFPSLRSHGERPGDWPDRYRTSRPRSGLNRRGALTPASPREVAGKEKRRPLFPSPRSYSFLTEREAGWGLGDWPPWAGKPPLFIPISLSTRGYARVFSLEIDSADFVGTFLSKNQNFCYTPSH